MQMTRVFIHEFLSRHPEITTVVQSVNGAKTSLLLGKQERMLFVNAYIAQQKVEAAKSLLRTTARDVREISDALPFSSAAYFTRLFRQQTGMTPTQFRQTQG